jgi:hypothetical protein
MNALSHLGGHLRIALVGGLVAAAVAASVGAAAGPATAAPEVVGGLSEAHELELGTATVPTASLTTATAKLGTHYAFGAYLNGKPVRWNPCAVIPWVSNTRRGPVGGLTVLKAAVAKIALTTGTTWVYKGEVSTVPSSAYLPRTARTSYPPVLLGWTDGAASDLLRGKPRNVLGVTRTAWFGVRTATTTVAATRAAVVALDRTDALPLRGNASWSSVALHELGHAFGLDHPSSTSQLMATTLPRSIAGLQPGDVAGLQKLGRSAGCVTIKGA